MDLPPNLLELPAEEAARLLALRAVNELAQVRPLLGRPEAPEALHDFRVALRRLRSCLRAWRPQLDASVSRRTRRRLRSLARATGRCRDLEVHVAWLRAQAETLRDYQRPGVEWLVTRLTRRRVKADRRLQRRLDRHFARAEARLRTRLPTYPAVVAAPALRPASAAAVLAQLVTRLSGDLGSRLGRVRSIADHTQAHQVRIAAKRLRYLLEPVAPRLEGASAIIARLKNAQDVLGELHDAHAFAADLAEALEEAAVEQTRRVSRELLSWIAGDPEEPAAMGDPRLGLMALAQRLRETVEQRFGEFQAGWLDGGAASFLHDARDLADRLAAPAAERTDLVPVVPAPAATPAGDVEEAVGPVAGERELAHRHLPS